MTGREFVLRSLTVAMWLVLYTGIWFGPLKIVDIVVLTVLIGWTTHAIWSNRWR